MDKYFTPDIDPKAPLPKLGDERVDTARFSSQDFMELEWRRLWRRVWNVGPRMEELSNPGDFVVHELGKESLLFVHGKDGIIRGFYNVCQHRGNLLSGRERCGNRSFLQCPYHAWSYNLDGSIKGIPGAQDFPQFIDGLPRDELSLVEFQVTCWAGFIFFKLDDGGPELDQFLGELKKQLSPYRLEDMRLYEYKTFLWDSNWKVACDAFNESYHFRGLHPQMLKWADERARLELIGDHSRMINKYGTTTSPFTGGKEIYPELREWMLYGGMNPDDYEGAPEDVWKAKVKFARQIQDDPGITVPYRDMTDAQLADVYHYFIFPGFAMNVFPEGVNAFRYRPHEKDPEKMYYDLIMLVHYPEGQKLPCEHKFFDSKVRYDEVADNPLSPIVTEVLQQDADNVSLNQRGLKSDGFRGLQLGQQEIRLRHFHEVLDRYMADIPEELTR